MHNCIVTAPAESSCSQRGIWLADTGWRLGAEASVGAAGGGAVKVGGGLVAQAQLQARYSLSPQWALQADAGWLRSRQGSLSSPLLGLSAVVSFSRLQGP